MGNGGSTDKGLRLLVMEMCACRLAPRTTWVQGSLYRSDNREITGRPSPTLTVTVTDRKSVTVTVIVYILSFSFGTGFQSGVPFPLGPLLSVCRIKSFTPP